MTKNFKKSTPGVLWALIADTFQEARARWLFWGLFGLSTMLISLFLFVLKIDLVASAISLFGVESTSHTIDVHRFVISSYAWISVVLYVWGTLLAVFASSGLIPSVLEPGRISLLLAKPITRPELLLGRYLGNLLVVAANHIYLICSIWVVIGLKTGVWEARFGFALAASLFIFAVLLCVVVLVGVITESAALSVMVAVALMIVSAILSQRQLVVRLLSSEWARDLWQMLYWIAPKVYDLAGAMRQIILYDSSADWVTPMWTSALFGLATLGTAIYIFQRRDF